MAAEIRAEPELATAEPTVIWTPGQQSGAVGGAAEVQRAAGRPVARAYARLLIAVCRQCHAEIHWRQPANDNQIQFRFFEEEDAEPGEQEDGPHGGR